MTDLRTQGIEALKVGNFDGAIKNFEDAIAANPGDINSYFFKGQALIQRGNQL